VWFSLGAWQTFFFPPPDGTSFDNRQLFVPFVVRQNLPCVSRRVFSYGARQNIF
jgi:hypothetical protein